MGICVHKTQQISTSVQPSSHPVVPSKPAPVEEAKLSGPVIRRKYVRMRKRSFQSSEPTEPLDSDPDHSEEHHIAGDCCGLIVGGQGKSRLWIAEEGGYKLLGVFIGGEENAAPLAVSLLSSVLSEHLRVRNSPQAALMAAFEAGREKLSKPNETVAICLAIVGNDAIWAGYVGDCTLILSHKPEDSKPQAVHLVLKEEPRTNDPDDLEVSGGQAAATWEPSLLQQGLNRPAAVLMGSVLIRERVPAPDTAAALWQGNPQGSAEIVARLARRGEGCVAGLALVVAYLSKT